MKHENKCDPEYVAKWQKKTAAATKSETTNRMTSTAADSSDESDGEDYRVMMFTTHAVAKEEGENAVQMLDANGKVVESVMTHSFNTTRA